MKFGKQLQKRQLDIPEYAASFVNYKGLKQLIKQLSATPTLLAQNASRLQLEVVDPQKSLQANKAAFFWRLERELEKVNVFYLQKEAELKLRLKTLLDKKKVMQSRGGTTPKVSASFFTLEEGFQQFGSDLNKLQRFVDINATAFSKILKKWDKTSKSRTKELYLSRAVEVQPCFNREIISELSDQATTSLLDLGAWAEGEKFQYDSSRTSDHTVIGQSFGTQENDADSQLLQAAISGNVIALKEWTARLRGSPDAAGRLTRTFLAAISEAPVECLNVLLGTDAVDVHAEDEINERNCLHEAAISGRETILELGLSRGVDVARIDVYGRLPLHYASIHGRVSMVRALLRQEKKAINSLDHDNFTPLIHGIIHHQFDCVQEMLMHGARIDPQSDADHVPLNLACQYGSVDIARLLLRKGAQILPDAEGLYPQHLVARKGLVPEMFLVLQENGADLDQKDKLYQWTPLFHAASEGHVHSVKILLEQGADVNILDEKGLPVMYYATWEGHLQCMKLLTISNGEPGALLTNTSSTLNASSVAVSHAFEPMKTDADGIPDLSLPPPIIPLRRYGHNFLDSKAFIQITFDVSNPDAILFFNDSKYPAARLTISSKSSDLIPRNVMLPIQEDFKSISFQVDSLDSFTVDFDVYPTFGSKVIARTVALPNIFSAIMSSAGSCCLPLFDPRLRAIGQISFMFQVIKPFRGIPLEIAQFETYWKATSHLDTYPSTLITGSSLSGEYIQLFVQLTSDGVPILCPWWTINHHGIECAVGRLSISQIKQMLGGRDHEVLRMVSTKTVSDVADIYQILANCLLTLKDVLACLPEHLHANIHVLYPSAIEERKLGLDPSLNINNFADAILKDVFEHARVKREQGSESARSIIFTSYNSDICTALNWKQPNYPVLLCNNLGADHDPNSTASVARGKSHGYSSISVKEAVRVAQSNNFMGLICTWQILDLAPALVEAIKVAGLVLVADTSSADGTVRSGKDGRRRDDPGAVPEGVDGVLQGNGVLRFSETVDL